MECLLVVCGRKMKKKDAFMLVLVKCYDNKMVKATPHLFLPIVDSALGKQKIISW